MTPAAPEFSRRLVDNPQKWEEWVSGFGTRNVATAIVATLFLTAAAEVATWMLRGHAAEDGRFGVIFPWILALATVGSVLVAQYQMRRLHGRKILLSCWVYAYLQVLWVAGLAWYSTPEFSVVLAVVLLAVAFHDARYMYDDFWIRLHYLVVWPAFFLILLLVDLLGGPGLLSRTHTHPEFVRVAVSFTATVAALLQAVIVVVGREWYASDSKVWLHARTQAQLAEMRREREVILRSCDFIAQGLRVGQFSHDVASPLSTVNLSVGQLAEDLGALAANLKSRNDEEILSRVVSLREAAAGIERGNARLHEMTTALLRSLRGGTASIEVDVAALMSAAVREMYAAASRHGITPVEPVLNLESAKVFATEEHAAAIGSVLGNGALQNPAAPLSLCGMPVTQHFYVISIRDHGVDGDARAPALERVRASLSLADPGARPEGSARSYQGYGMGLTLAKLLLVRNNGWLSVDAPSQGPGLVFRLVLPRCAPDAIPVGENCPERLAAQRLPAAES